MNWFSKLSGKNTKATESEQSPVSANSDHELVELVSQKATKESNPFDDIQLPIVPSPSLTQTPIIWYVDDEPINLVVFENVMESTGYQIRMFNRAEDLLDTIGQEEMIPHVILADIMMPGINGYDLLWVIRKHYDWDTLPIIMLSAKTREEDVSRALDLGANDFLFKPFVKVDFLTRLNMFVKIQAEEE